MRTMIERGRWAVVAAVLGAGLVAGGAWAQSDGTMKKDMMKKDEMKDGMAKDGMKGGMMKDDMKKGEMKDDMKNGDMKGDMMKGGTMKGETMEKKP